MADNPTKSDSELFAQRGFGLRIGFGDRPALIIIDMANAFTDETAMLGSNLDDQIAATIPIANNSLDSDVSGSISGGGGLADSYYQPLILGWAFARADLRARKLRSRRRGRR